MKNNTLIVVGGGAAGMMAAIAAARAGVRVSLLERNLKLGRKLYITGKGRCNVTNHCSAEEVLASTPRNSRFLYSAMSHTPPAEVERFFDRLKKHPSGCFFSFPPHILQQEGRLCVI